MFAALNPYRGLSRRKIFGVLAFCCAMGVLIVAAGQWWIVNSEPYELGRLAVSAKINASVEAVWLDRLTGFEFVDGDSGGHAHFVLCGPPKRCFTVIARKIQERWGVAELKEQE